MMSESKHSSSPAMDELAAAATAAEAAIVKEEALPPSCMPAQMSSCMPKQMTYCIESAGRAVDCLVAQPVKSFFGAMNHPLHGRSWNDWVFEWFCVYFLWHFGGMVYKGNATWITPKYFFKARMDEIPLYIDSHTTSWNGVKGGQTISNFTLVFGSMCPIALFLLACLFPPLSSKKKWSERFAEFQITALAWFLSFGMEMVLFGVLCNLIGEWRPDAMARCSPDPVRVAARLAECAARGNTGGGGCTAWPNDRYRDVDGVRTLLPGICRNNLGVGPDGMYVGQANMSFISGHSAFTAVSMTFTALWFAGKTRAFCSGRERAVWKHAFVLLCWFVALFVSASRTADKRHQWYNCLFGTIIGVVCGATGYFYYFPSIWAPLSHSPLAMEEEAGDLASKSTWASGRLLLLLQTNGRPSLAATRHQKTPAAKAA